MSQAEKDWAALTPEQQAAARAQAPVGVPAVMSCLMAIQTKRFANQAEYQGLIKYMVEQMPLDLRVAVLNADEATVLATTGAVVQADKDLSEWIFQPGVFDWIRSFVASLPPSLEVIHGPAQQQRDQLAAMQQGATAPEAAPAAVEPVAAAEAAPVVAPSSGTEQTPELPDNGPSGELPEGGPGASHLDDPDAP